jgi:hypothetical protein
MAPSRNFSPSLIRKLEVIRSRPVLGALALGLLGSRAAQAQESTGDATHVRVVRRVEQHSGAALLWEPYIAQWKPRQLGVAFGAGIPGKTDMGDILSTVSTDDGETWAEPGFVFDHRERQGSQQYAYANPVLYHPPGEDILWCFAMRCPMNSPHSEDSHLAGAYSAGGGRSWVPVEMSMLYTGPLIIVAGVHRIVVDGHPRYLLPAHRNTKRSDPLGTRDQFILSSTSLLEWKLEGYIPPPESGPVFLHEGSLAPGDAEGDLKIVMRTARYDKDGAPLDPPRAFSSQSRDGGRTWSSARPEPELWNSVAKGFYGRSSEGTELYVYNDGAAWSRMALRYKSRAPGGAWSAERTFYEAGVHNSYPTLIEISPGEFRAVWDSGTPDRNRTRICFGKFRLRAGKD